MKKKGALLAAPVRHTSCMFKVPISLGGWLEYEKKTGPPSWLYLPI